MGKLKITLTKKQYNAGFEACKEYVLLHTGWHLTQYAYAARGAAYLETTANSFVLGLEMTALEYAVLQEEKQYLEWGYTEQKASECASQSADPSQYCKSFYLRD
jgi:hypothetical protein